MTKKELDYLTILRALSEIPFPVGKQLLITFLQGKTNDSIERNKLQKLPSYATMAYTKEELADILQNLLLNNLIEQISIPTNTFAKVLQLTEKGKQELKSPTLHKKKLAHAAQTYELQISKQEKELFNAFDFFLNQFNEAQKKAITSPAKHILCIAGAGSGKTTVLTKRIEFLTKYKGINEQNILAITFTRKARQEMMRRLGTTNFHVETFNSFCEKILRKYTQEIYGKPVHVMTYADKMRAFRLALNNLSINPQNVIQTYYTIGQQRSKTEEQLMRNIMHDCFTILDYFKLQNKPLEPFIIDHKHANSAKMIHKVCTFLEHHMKNNGLRDFTDQLLDTITFFKKSPQHITQYTHVLVDEYQDVNEAQIELLKLLHPENLFCVGDPRQSIFGWRGSKIQHILNFEEKYPDSNIIPLQVNYRSTKPIVKFINESIKDMHLPDLESLNAKDSNIYLLKCNTEQEENALIIDKIKNADCPLDELFVLARTNKQLTQLSEQFKAHNIPHIVKTDELRNPSEDVNGAVTLATIHAIKGLEAETVFLTGCNTNYFPCKTSDHPIIDLIQYVDYDKEEEEKRLFYVALSRTKQHIYVTYTGTLSRFFTQEMQKHVTKTNEESQKPLYKIQSSKTIHAADTIVKLKEWRTQTANELGVPAFLIMHDKTLYSLAEMKPQNIIELQSVHGFGPAKTQRYGKQLLDVLWG
ncbi:hypothetical protein COV18_05085 [Candidatus Woesearchaeota archaeon CG10_big_fil_rev_8_21_14_0_10_37_12]|nr:MAG: hypothetical protein COV18_05085 [Candidatus Woesearchaeota archaeon CG10_big_fil_rev_8_21_14_0_10_37_12]